MDLTAKYYICCISVDNHIRTDTTVRGNLLYTDAIELLKTYIPNPDAGSEISRTKFSSTGWVEYCVVAEPKGNDVDELPFDEIPF